MLKLFSSVRIEASPEAVWERLSRLEDLPLWVQSVRHATCAGHPSRGVGATRTCTLAGNVQARERIVAWDEGKSFTYEATGLPFVKRGRNKWSVHPDGEHAVVTTEAEIELKGGLLGRILEPLMAILSRRMAPEALAGLKYLVENGRPFEGKASQLPRPLSVC